MRTPLQFGLASAVLLAACTTTQSAGNNRLWIANLQLCETTVAEVSEAADFAGQPALRVTLTDSAAAELADITSRMIGEKLPIGLGDNVVVEPVVQERIAGGVFDISPLPDQDLERIKQVMREAC